MNWCPTKGCHGTLRGDGTCPACERAAHMAAMAAADEAEGQERAREQKRRGHRTQVAITPRRRTGTKSYGSTRRG